MFGSFGGERCLMCLSVVFEKSRHLKRKTLQERSRESFCDLTRSQNFETFIFAAPVGLMLSLAHLPSNCGFLELGCFIPALVPGSLAPF